MIGVLPPAARDGRFAPAAFLRLSASAPLSRSPNRRPKPRAKDIWDEVESKRRHRVGECNARWQKPDGRA